MDCIYPNYYLSPYNEGKKLRLAPDNETVKDMVYHTLERFGKTCFGNSCTKGECITAGICVLRLLAADQPTDEIWINKLLAPLGEAFLSFGSGQAASQKKISISYLLMAFTDINNDKTRNLLRKKGMVSVSPVSFPNIQHATYLRPLSINLMKSTQNNLNGFHFLIPFP